MKTLINLFAPPQVPKTSRFLNTAYPCLNEHGLAIGEMTIGGRSELYNPEGMFVIEEVERIVLEHAQSRLCQKKFATSGF